jgi:hypothetical protein
MKLAARYVTFSTSFLLCCLNSTTSISTGKFKIEQRFDADMSKSTLSSKWAAAQADAATALTSATAQIRVAHPIHEQPLPPIG